ncbi:helix-turn-helix transcriptional regulator [Bacillus cytotoxicus]|uniref:Helix-turn-helix transcriptional regulator n=1 Tax=Bacillus cytotoxicus TaxID=580165 RepID=A0ACC6A6D2_9BACI|nr:helix-turn-helix transcriptional regulator [Bacillus cytotoxicus]
MKFTLGKSLEDLGITKNKLSVEAKVRSNTVGDLVNGDASSIRFDTLEAILDTLNRIAKEKGIDKTYVIDDVVKYIKKS